MPTVSGTNQGAEAGGNQPPVHGLEVRAPGDAPPLRRGSEVHGPEGLWPLPDGGPVGAAIRRPKQVTDADRPAGGRTDEVHAAKGLVRPVLQPPVGPIAGGVDPAGTDGP